MVLTNNWAPGCSMNATSPFPRSYFSNDYGGMDTIVQQIAPGSTHDVFYTNERVVAAYKQYIDKIVLRYTNSAAVFTWEIANDPRCGGAGNFVSGPNCTPQTITRWSADSANHMVASGDAEFYCLLDHTGPTKYQKLNPSLHQPPNRPMYPGVNCTRRKGCRNGKVL
ncbi:hypothetical protein FRC02_005169 [Tulasnella sp. 418]|nr:hypothetical protein FRC02_005169 [Tulasnella sp. 418]